MNPEEAKKYGIIDKIIHWQDCVNVLESGYCLLIIFTYDRS
jgi:hypothetical protein